ncbi:hypothetical protein OH76DRAFT_308727 [Lentinus brumalis]|uniref:N-acetyltransferase domain-containing protein n=1 Tax=Lentinus brumalis TaxID=2498619 RepID=A0A371CKA4_9APHY|nr:hypothetical protein OH76DRAFT_308727 [Polyporus brumalis]
MAPPNVTFEFVDHPTEEAKEVFAGVMKHDPVAKCLTGGDLNLIPLLGLTFLRALLLSPGVSHMFTARDDTGALVGFTVFTLPGQLMLSTQEQRENAKLSEFASQLSEAGREFYAETMDKLIPKANDKAFGIEDSERNTYWCNFAMVRSDYQGKGVAKALFGLAFKEADKLGATVALTTTNEINVPIYEKIGFQQPDEKVTYMSPWTEWYLWFFKRSPSGSKSATEVITQARV